MEGGDIDKVKDMEEWREEGELQRGGRELTEGGNNKKFKVNHE